MRCRDLMALVGCIAILVHVNEGTLAKATTENAWGALWSNQAVEALALFNEALDQDKNDPSAWRGLLLSELLLGRDDRISKTLDQYARRTMNEPHDWYITSTVDSYSGLNSSRYYRSLYDFIRRLRNLDSLPVVDRRIFMDQRVHYAWLRGDPGRSGRLARDLGRLTDWAVLGPFDNTSGSGHDRMHIEDWNRFWGPFEGKYGQAILHFFPSLVAVDDVIKASQYFHEDKETTAYLRTVVVVPRSGRYLLSLSHGGDVDLWIDGELLFSGSRLTGGREVAHWDIALSEGPHLLAAKLSNREDTSQLGIGLSTLDGKPARVALKPAERFYPTEGTPLDAREVRPTFLGDLANRLEMALSGGENPENVFWGLRQAVRTAEPDSVVNLCRRIEEIFPHVAVLWLACGMAYSQVEEADHAEHAMARARELDPSLVLPQIHAASEDLRRKRYGAAHGTCDAILERAPRCIWALELKLRTLLEQQDLEAVQALARQLTRDMSDMPIGHEYLAAWARNRGMVSAARRHERDALRRRPPFAEHVNRLVQGSQQEDYKEAKKTIKRLIEYMPDAAWLWSSLVESKLALDDYTKAKETIDEALPSFPQNVTLLFYKALFAEAGVYWPYGTAGGKENAARILSTALNHMPGNLQLRDKQRTLQGKTPYREFLPDPVLSETLARRVNQEEFPGQRAVVLQEWKRRLFFERDVSLLDFYIAVHVLNNAGVEAWKKIPTGVPAAGRVLLANKTIKPDGAEHEATVVLGEVHFENLEPGDVVLLHFQSTQFQGGLLKGHTWDQHRFYFLDPCLESRYELIYQRKHDLQVELHNDDALGNQVEVQEKILTDGFRQDGWVLYNMVGLAAEANATNQLSYLPWVDISTVPSWQMIAAWYSDLAAGQANVTRAVRAKAVELCSSIDDPAEKIERIYQFVAQEVNYVSVPFYMSAHIPRDAGEVLSSRFGDCKDKSCLMIAMLKAVGIDDARFALVDLWGDRTVELLPSPRFNHAIVCRPDGRGGYEWYDPSIKYGTTRQVPGSLAGGLALIADPEISGLTVIEASPITEYPSLVNSHVAISADGSAQIQRQTKDSFIDKTSDHRNQLENLTGERLREALLDNIAIMHPGAVLESLTVVGRSSVDSLLVYDFTFTAPQLLQESGQYLVGRVPWASRFSTELNRMIARSERRSPIDLHRLTSCEIETLTVIIPEGFEIVELPASRNLSFGDCRYSISYNRESNKLLARCEIVFIGDRVPPQDYPEFKQFIEAVLQDQRTSLIIRQRSGH